VVARIWQDALARCVACEAMAEATGISLAYDAPPPTGTSSFDPFAELLAARLDREAGPPLPGPSAAESHGYARLADAVRCMVNCGCAVEERLVDDVAECAAVPGPRPRSVAGSLAQLSEAVRAPRGFDFPAVLSVLARDARRRLEVLRPLQRAEIWEDAVPLAGPPEVSGPSPGSPVLPLLRETVIA
jgi:hypothetical protein